MWLRKHLCMRKVPLADNQGLYWCPLHDEPLQLSRGQRLISHFFDTHEPEEIVNSGFDLEQLAEKKGQEKFADAFKKRNLLRLGFKNEMKRRGLDERAIKTNEDEKLLEKMVKKTLLKTDTIPAD